MGDSDHLDSSLDFVAVQGRVETRRQCSTYRSLPVCPVLRLLRNQAGDTDAPARLPLVGYCVDHA